MKNKKEGFDEEGLQFSASEETEALKTEVPRKVRIKHKRGPRKKKREEEERSDEPRSFSYDRPKKTYGRKRKGKKAAAVVGGVIGAAVLAYLGGAWYFNSHFYLNTTINGNDFSAKSIKEVEKYMEKQVKGYKLTLKEIDGGTEEISGQDIDISYKPGDEFEKVKKEQNPFLWIRSLWSESNVTASIGIEYDEAKLDAVLSGLDCAKEENQTPSQNAQPKYEKDQFVIQPEVIGTQIDQENFKKAAAEYIGGFKTEMDMHAAGCYHTPKYTSESKEVQNAVAEMNKYLQSRITYDLSPKTEVVGKDQISQWLTVDENMEVAFDTKKINAFLAQLATKYNTVGTTRKFVSGRGDTVNVSGGDFGWYLNQKDEYAALTANIKSGQQITREPKWKRRGADHGDMNDYGKTYAEVDLTTQHFWFFQDGKAIMSCDVTTGKPNGKDDTPQGSYDLTYKTKNAVLRGEKLPNGKYSYESPVSFWMPFNGGIGFHDASWQTKWGGQWYKTHGSHGCINMKYNDAKQLYDLINETTPIICHF